MREAGKAQAARPDAALPWTRWFGRFEVRSDGEHHCLLRDWLQEAGVRRPWSVFAARTGQALEQAFFCEGLAPAAWGSFPTPVADRPRDTDDSLFWQFPCRTEAQAFERHARLPRPVVRHGSLHCYLGLPWATFIDRDQWPELEASITRTRLRGLSGALAECGLSLRVHTVCQHIDWQRLVPRWLELGVTDLWLSHLPREGLAPEAAKGLAVHPWSLYAVNVEDPERRVGLTLGKDPANKRWLATFSGAHMPHYLSEVRLKLKALSNEPDMHVEVNTEAWHFEGVVYAHQVRNEPIVQHYRIDDTVRRYNEGLSDSVFALCPAGAGPNTLRLWEALAVGSIPVLLGPEPMLPQRTGAPAIDWDAAVLRWDVDRVAELPARLRAMPLQERRARQSAGQAAYAEVLQQRCF